jgi:hypothetical protein
MISMPGLYGNEGAVVVSMPSLFSFFSFFLLLIVLANFLEMWYDIIGYISNLREARNCFTRILAKQGIELVDA